LYCRTAAAWIILAIEGEPGIVCTRGGGNTHKSGHRAERLPERSRTQNQWLEETLGGTSFIKFILSNLKEKKA